MISYQSELEGQNSKYGTAPGQVPLNLALVLRVVALTAFASTNLVESFTRYFHGHQRFNDVVTGAVTFSGLNKGEDFFELGLFFALFSVIAFLLLRFFRHFILQSKASGWLESILDVPLCLGAYWLGLQLANYNGQIRLTAVNVSLAFAILFLIAVRHHVGSDAAGVHQATLGFLMDAMLIFFGGCGVGIVLCNVLPGVFTDPFRIALRIFKVTSGALLILFYWKPAFALSKTFRTNTRFVIQSSIPLLFFCLLPRECIQLEKSFPGYRSLQLVLALTLICFCCWVLLYKRWRKCSKTGIRHLRKQLEPVTLSAIAVFLAASNTFFPVLTADDFHLGEQFLPWQQLIDFRRLPYIDFIPIHGVMPLARGLLNQVFFDGTLANYVSADLLLIGVAMALTFVMLFRLGGIIPAFLFCLTTSFGPAGDRFLFAAPILIYVSVRSVYRVFSSYVLRIFLALGFGLLYNIAVGMALCFAAIPGVIQEIVHVVGRRVKIGSRLLVAIGVAAVSLCLIPTVRHMAEGFIWFAIHGGESNLTANGIKWSGISSAVAAPQNTVSSALLFWLMKFGWILFTVLVLGLLVAWLVSKPRMLLRSNNRFPMAVVFFSVVISAWTMGRIDPAGFSRPGSFSAVFVAAFLPFLITRYFTSGPWTAQRGRVQLAILTFIIGLYAPLTNNRIDLQSISARLSPVVNVPPDLEYVSGTKVGIASLGSIFVSPAWLQDVLQIKNVVTHFIGNSGTYFDITNRQLLYALLNRKEPVIFPAYIADDYPQQERILQQLRNERPHLVFAAPAYNFDGPTGLRSYLLYRYAILNYRPCQVGSRLFLIDPSFERSLCNPESDMAALNPVFAMWSLGKLPSAWGQSWASLSHLFESTPNLIAKSNSPGEEIILNDLNIDPSKYDFLTFQIACGSCSNSDVGPAVSWVSDLGASSGVIGFSQQSGRVLIPMGSFPEWLLSRRIYSLKVRFTTAKHEAIVISDIRLLHYKPDAAVPEHIFTASGKEVSKK